MKRCAYIDTNNTNNAFGSSSVVCPKPRRVRPFNLSSYQVENSDSRGGSELLDIFLTKKMIVEELDPGIAGPTQVKELTAEVAANPSTHGDRELPKQPALKPKCLFLPPEAPIEDQFLGLKDSLQRDRKRKIVSD
ncbi:hypothetical protein AgCh_011946 [Apium graveolens]